MYTYKTLTGVKVITMNLINKGTFSALLYILKIQLVFEICRLNNLHLPVTFSTYLPFQSEPGQTPAERAVMSVLTCFQVYTSFQFTKTTTTK